MIDNKKIVLTGASSGIGLEVLKLLAKGKKISPCFLFGVSKVLMTVFPFVRSIYWRLEQKKLERFVKKTRGTELFK